MEIPPPSSSQASLQKFDMDLPRAIPLGSRAPQESPHALQDYQMQLMLLEMQNKKRLMIARQEHENQFNAHLIRELSLSEQEIERRVLIASRESARRFEEHLMQTMPLEEERMRRFASQQYRNQYQQLVSLEMQNRFASQARGNQYRYSQLTLLEQRNKRRLLAEREASDNVSRRNYQLQLMHLEQYDRAKLMMEVTGEMRDPRLRIEELEKCAVSRESICQEHRSRPPASFPRALRCPDSSVNQKTLAQPDNEAVPESFPQFSRLSPELRVKIWTYASQQPRIVELYIAFRKPGAITSLSRPPAVLLVNRECK